MQHRITSAQFAEWCAKHANDPFGAMRDDIRMGRLICMIAAAFGDKNPDIEDHILNTWAKKDKRQTMHEQMELFKALASWTNTNA